MGIDNPIHLAFLLLVVLLVFGAKRLPELGRSLGSGMRGFRDALGGIDAPAPLAAPAAIAAAPAVAAPAGEESAARCNDAVTAATAAITDKR